MRPRRTEGRSGLNEVLNQPVATLDLVPPISRNLNEKANKVVI